MRSSLPSNADIITRFVSFKYQNFTFCRLLKLDEGIENILRVFTSLAYSTEHHGTR